MNEVLAVFYVTYLLTQTSGPYGVLDVARAKFSKETSWLGGILYCYWCASIYVAVPVSLTSEGVAIESFVWALSIAGEASLLIWVVLKAEDCIKSVFDYLAASLERTK